MTDAPENFVSSVGKFVKVVGNTIGSLAYPTKTTVMDAATGDVLGHYSAEELERRAEEARKQKRWR